MIYDKDIREPLFEYLEEYYHKVRFFQEKIIGKARADIVMVIDGAVCGVEIKSDADTYVRLAGQVKSYEQYFDMNIVVVGSSHGLHIAEHVPEYWGIITVEENENGLDFYYLRQPCTNPKMKLDKKITILWRWELAHIQELNGMHKYARESKAFVRGKIIEKVPAEILQNQISDELFERDYTAIADRINEFREANGKRKRRKTKKIPKRNRSRHDS